jgi:hypothetical protein
MVVDDIFPDLSVLENKLQEGFVEIQNFDGKRW